MKLLKELKNQLLKLTFGRPQKNQNVQNTRPKTLISKTFSKDEDTFMFI